jgi:hypothetical protein
MTLSLSCGGLGLGDFPFPLDIVCVCVCVCVCFPNLHHGKNKFLSNSGKKFKSLQNDTKCFFKGKVCSVIFL